MGITSFSLRIILEPLGGAAGNRGKQREYITHTYLTPQYQASLARAVRWSSAPGTACSIGVQGVSYMNKFHCCSFCIGAIFAITENMMVDAYPTSSSPRLISTTVTDIYLTHLEYGRNRAGSSKQISHFIS